MINAWTDWKKREIDVRYTLIFVIMVILFGAGKETCVTGILPGGLLWMLSKLVNGYIGEGDGIVCMAAGWVAGFWNIISVIFLACVFVCIYSVYRRLVNKVEQKELPFVPFLLAGWMMI